MSQQENTVATDHQDERNNRKTARGYVVSDKMDKTVVVEVEDRVKHALYGKVMRRTSRLKVHDEQNDCGVGEDVAREAMRLAIHKLPFKARFIKREAGDI